jgi:hypothetical protein
MNKREARIRIPSNGVIRTTLHFQFYFELKETFEKTKLPQLLATNCGIIKKYLHPNRTFITYIKNKFQNDEEIFSKNFMIYMLFLELL